MPPSASSRHCPFKPTGMPSGSAFCFGPSTGPNVRSIPCHHLKTEDDELMLITTVAIACTEDKRRCEATKDPKGSQTIVSFRCATRRAGLALLNKMTFTLERFLNVKDRVTMHLVLMEQSTAPTKINVLIRFCDRNTFDRTLELLESSGSVAERTEGTLDSSGDITPL